MVIFLVKGIRRDKVLFGRLSLALGLKPRNNWEEIAVHNILGRAFLPYHIL
ncbi:MAG: hypothetical protein QME81_11045 [bacterium]|nr:hypothetical protein [bacterium]